MAIHDLEKFLSKNRDRFATVEGNLLSAAGGDAIRTVLVTGCRPRQGATLTAVCLAYALSSEAGCRTLLIDTCVRAPRLHVLFDLEDGPGLSDVMDGKTDLAKALHPTPFPHLTLLPRGRKPGRPLNAVRRNALVSHLTTLAEQFDYIVIDTDPLFTSSGVSLLAPHADGVLLVVQSGRTRRADVAEAQAKIDQVGGTLLGAILNKASA